MGRRWWRFICERFPLATNLPMALLFAGANLAVAIRAGEPPIARWQIGVGLVLTLSFLFRLRLFDELKDYTTDVRINPDRPLPRGLLTRHQVRAALAALTVGELALVGISSVLLLFSPRLVPPHWALTHVIAVGFSFLMSREFFIGAYLRPRLTAYAVTHTAASALLGWSMAALATGRVLWELPPALLAFGLANWMLFNVFEFARKSCAPAEEGPGVDSYSSLYSAGGATLLTLSQVAIALGVLWWLPGQIAGPARLLAEVAGAGVLLLAGILYTWRPTHISVRLYRAAAAGFIVWFYATLV